MNGGRLPAGRWHVPGARRVSGLPPSEQGPVLQFFLGLTRRASGGDKVLDVFSLLARLGAVFPRYLLFLSHILKGGRISRADKERVILRVAWRVGCIYEWGHHVPMARELGMRDDEILSLAEEDSPQWDERTRALLRAADELVEHRVLGDAARQALADELTENQLVEFCMLVGHYLMVAMTINSCGLALEPDYLEALPAVAERAHGRQDDRSHRLQRTDCRAIYYRFPRPWRGGAPAGAKPGGRCRGPAASAFARSRYFPRIMCT